MAQMSISSTILVVLIGLVIYRIVTQTPVKNFYDENPQLASYTISNGVKINSPAFIHNSTHYIVYGWIDVEEVQKLIDAERGSGPASFAPAKFVLPSGETKAGVMFNIVQNFKMDVEEYDEVLFNYLVTDDANAEPVQCADDGFACIPIMMDKFKFWVEKLYLSSEVGLLFGREMYGINKIRVQKAVISEKDKKMTATFDKALEAKLDVTPNGSDAWELVKGAVKQIGIGGFLQKMWDSQIVKKPIINWLYSSRGIAKIANFDNHNPLSKVLCVPPDTEFLKFNPTLHSVKSTEVNLKKVDFVGIGVMRNYRYLLTTPVNLGSGLSVKA